MSVGLFKDVSSSKSGAYIFKSNCVGRKLVNDINQTYSLDLRVLKSPLSLPVTNMDDGRVCAPVVKIPT